MNQEFEYRKLKNEIVYLLNKRPLEYKTIQLMVDRLKIIENHIKDEQKRA